MPGRSHRESVGKQIWRIGAWIALALLLVAAMRFLTKLYMVHEILVVLLLLAVSTVTILAFAVAFISLHAGICRAALWVKAGAIRHASLSPATKQGG
jgi:membrane protein YdbS with pleckstrin-like domain